MIKNKKEKSKKQPVREFLQFITILNAGLVVILSIIIFSFKTGAVYSQSGAENGQTKDAVYSTKLNIYENSDLNFSFIVPTDWSYYISGNYPNFVLNLIPTAVYEKNKNTNPVVSILVYDSPSSEYQLNFFYCSKSDCFKKAKETSVNDNDALSVEYDLFNFPFRRTVIEKNNKTYEINVHLNSQYQEILSVKQKADIYNQILSTIKFTE